MNWRHLMHYMLEAGPGATLTRAMSTLHERATPMTPPTPYAPPLGLTWEAWQKAQTGHGRLAQARAWWTHQPIEAQRLVIEQGYEAVQGHIECWGESELAFKDAQGTWKWHQDPITGHIWDPTLPAHLGWLGSTGTDIKTIWEVARFDFSLIWLRSQCIDAQPFWTRAWIDTTRSWIAANPYGKGVHWTNGQEIAIRGLNWLFAATHLAALPEEAFTPWCVSLAEHAYAVAHHHPHTCISVPNNHVVLEAVFLLHSAKALPWHPDAAQWTVMAQCSLLEALKTQWFGDGGYIQHAHTYHRLAAWALVWARDVLEPQEDQNVLQHVHNTLAKSRDHLRAFTGLKQGALPLYGPHDGACWPRLHSTDSNDRRPLLQALTAITQHTTLYPPGPWDEAMQWLGLNPSTDCEDPPSLDVEKTFADSGLSILRQDEDTFGVLVHGPKRGMFGQDDLMHVSLVWRGHRLTLDAGSYRYTGFPEEHRWFHGAQGHCSVTAHAEGARLEAGYFSWAMVPGTKAMVPGTKAMVPGTLRARRTGFAASRARDARSFHERALTQTPTGWEVEDIVHGLDHGIQGRWLLPAYDWTLMQREDGAWHLGARHHPWGEDLCVRIIVEGEHVEDVFATLEQGWWAPYYGGRVQVPLLCVNVAPLLGQDGPRARWRTRFVLQKE